MESALAGGAEAAKTKAVLAGELFGISRLLGRLGVNVNQIARATNATRRVQPEMADCWLPDAQRSIGVTGASSTMGASNQRATSVTIGLNFRMTSHAATRRASLRAFSPVSPSPRRHFWIAGTLTPIIRPTTDPPVDWADWVNTSILGPVDLSDAVGLAAKQWQGLAVYGPADGRSLVLRYSPGEGQAVVTGQELVRSRFTPGPFMWIDIDSFWQHESSLPEFDTQALVAKCDELHLPIRTLFEKLITPKLRDEVLRRG